MNAKEEKLGSVRAEIARERAEALARGTRKLRITLEALRELDSGGGRDGNRTRLVAEASEACLALLVQREVMGFGAQDAEAIRREYQVPPEVWNAMGASPHS